MRLWIKLFALCVAFAAVGSLCWRHHYEIRALMPHSDAEMDVLQAERVSAELKEADRRDAMRSTVNASGGTSRPSR